MQLEEQTAAFVGDPKINYLDDKGTLHLSKIFDWYERDFRESKGSVLDFVRPYIEALQALAETGKTPPIEDQDYDWSLNEASLNSKE
jgi:hypothetical protein